MEGGRVAPFFCSSRLALSAALLWIPYGEGATFVLATLAPPHPVGIRWAGTLVLLAVIALVSLWTSLEHPAIAERWFSLPNLIYFAPVPVLVLVLVTTWGILRALKGQPHAAPFLLALGLVFLGYTACPNYVFRGKVRAGDGYQ